MKIAGKVEGINKERRVSDVSGAGGQRGGVAIGERAVDVIIPIRVGCILVNDGIFGIHAIDATAVADAYGWPPDLTDDQILEHLLALNLERAAEEEKQSKAPKPKTQRPKDHDELV